MPAVFMYRRTSGSRTADPGSRTPET